MKVGNIDVVDDVLQNQFLKTPAEFVHHIFLLAEACISLIARIRHIDQQDAQHKNNELSLHRMKKKLQ